MFAVPLGLAVFLVRRFRLEWRIFLIGAGTFAGAQILEVPFNRFLLQPGLQSLGIWGADQGWSLVSMAIIFGLVAGVFEEIARYVVYRRWLKDERSWEGGIFFGLGHGAMEAMLLGALSFYVLLQTITYRNADLATLVAPDQLVIAKAQLDAYWSAPWYAALLGSLERVFAMGIQISLSVIVLQVFTRRNHIWLAFAIAWHMIVDAVAVFGASTWGIYTTELTIGVMAALSLVFLYLLKPGGWGAESLAVESDVSVEERRRKVVKPVDDLPLDRLDDSRYDEG